MEVAENLRELGWRWLTFRETRGSVNLEARDKILEVEKKVLCGKREVVAVEARRPENAREAAIAEFTMQRENEGEMEWLGL